MATPKYTVNQVVYVRESAALGFLIPYRIDGASQARDGNWFYSIVISRHDDLTGRPISQPFGDRITRLDSEVLMLAESELLLYCDALKMAKEAIDKRRATLTSLASSCP